jgi:hypothetical protein
LESIEVDPEAGFPKAKKICSDFCDVDIQVENHSVRAHRLVLAEASPVWHNLLLLKENQKTLKLNYLSYEVFQQIYNFLYNREISTEWLEKHVVALLNAAKMVNYDLFSQFDE